jgi:serine protease AprX
VFSRFRRAATWRVSLSATVAAVVTLAAPAAADAASIPPKLLEQARAHPGKPFRVIVEGRGSGNAAFVRIQAHLAARPGNGTGIERRLGAVRGTAARLPGRIIAALAEDPEIVAITPDAAVRRASLSSRQQWPYVSGVARSWRGVKNGSLRMPAIAIVDSGIDAARADFGGRVVADVNLTTVGRNSPGDGRGHGTFVAGIAAGSASLYTGAAPGAPIVSLDVMDDSGTALTSDVIAACDWILQNKERLNIRVANFSLHSSHRTSAFASPLNRAVERLWLSGVVVVAASGNFGSGGQPTTMGFAPGNDPFVITVGANDIAGTVTTSDDKAAPWSAFGYTLDGFAKPDLGAPGRYMVGPVSAGATLAGERPERIIAPGYMQLSGTSFSAPVVAGAAAYVLAVRPGWTPGQVKGALMASVRRTPSAVPLSLGVGELHAGRAVDVASPPDLDRALSPFLVPDPGGSLVPVFDSGAWAEAARQNRVWDVANWSDANWSDANWSDANWSDSNWSDANWSDANWSDDVSSDMSWADNAEDDFFGNGAYWISDADLAAAEDELGLE